MAKRDKPCTCGSGRKLKACCEGRKKSIRALTFDLGEGTLIDGISMSPSGEVRIHGPNGIVKPRGVETSTYRERTKSPKVLTRAPLDHHFTVDEWLPLAQYDGVLCIDTNTRSIDGTMVSVAAIFQLKAVKKFDGATLLGIAQLGAFEFHGIESDQENIAWWLLTQAVLTGPDHVFGRLYALITDSDLGNHESYNGREKPIWGNYKLPPQFTLMYASDSGTHILNRAIKECDREAGSLLRKLEAGSPTIDSAPKAPSRAPFERYRFWRSPPAPGLIRLSTPLWR